MYLDVWERLVTDLEDDALRDVAITGADTARRQVIWQVRVTPWRCDGGAPTSDTFPLEDWRNALRGGSPRLRAATQPTDTSDGLGADPDTGFRGAENHLYRVEIASAGTGDDPALFSWSRDNGSVAATWIATQGNRLSVTDSDDGRRLFAPGDWVELTWESLEVAGITATRVQLAAVDGHTLTVDPDTASGRIEPDPAGRAHATVRRWDQRDTAATHLVEGAIEVPGSATEWIPLEDGIWIEFDRGDTDAPFRVGDYWTIPARTATADVDWPRDANAEPVFLPPQGPVHHYAPLAYVADGKLVLLQKAFQPLAR